MSTSATDAASQTAAAIHRRAIIVDGHCDTPYRLHRHNLHIDDHDPEAQLDLRSLQESGITASFFAAYVPPFYANRGAAGGNAGAAHVLLRLGGVDPQPHVAVRDQRTVDVALLLTMVRPLR